MIMLSKPLAILLLVMLLVASAACQDSDQIAPEPSPIVTTQPVIFPTPLPATEYDPSYFLPMLGNISSAFAEFYQAEIAPLHVTIHWIHDRTLPPGVLAMTGQFEDGSWGVFVASMPPQEQDVLVVAHELAGLVIAARGFRGPEQTAKQWQDIAVSLYDIISTPIRDSILADYGFDVEGNFQRQTGWLSAQPCSEEISILGIHRGAWGYATFALYWQDVLGHDGMHRVPLDVDMWYQDCRPSARVEGQSILVLVAEIGYQTPVQARELFQRIIRDYHLEPYMAMP